MDKKKKNIVVTYQEHGESEDVNIRELDFHGIKIRSTLNEHGRDYFGEECARISISAFALRAKILEAVGIALGAVEVAGKKIRIKESSLHLGGQRLYFVCPLCERNFCTLFVHPLTASAGCRRCLKLKKRKLETESAARGIITRTNQEWENDAFDIPINRDHANSRSLPKYRRNRSFG